MRHSHSEELIIFRASITTPDGRKIYAKDYGKKPFILRIKRRVKTQ
ncbi:MAG TPA: hypothetical protein GX510_09250 [Firmicutes bacterium]|nr:hypothetical protein [Candidatus Fermentithermobacillaceae bacterium]